LITEANALGIKVVRHWEGDEFNVGGARVDVLFPPHNDSMVLRVSYGATSVLLEGPTPKKPSSAALPAFTRYMRIS
jgi:beta-lactamase superfamily II metal-dependent hydrolase